MVNFGLVGDAFTARLTIKLAGTPNKEDRSESPNKLAMLFDKKSLRLIVIDITSNIVSE